MRVNISFDVGQFKRNGWLADSGLFEFVHPQAVLPQCFIGQGKSSLGQLAALERAVVLCSSIDAM